VLRKPAGEPSSGAAISRRPVSDVRFRNAMGSRFSSAMKMPAGGRGREGLSLRDRDQYWPDAGILDPRRRGQLDQADMPGFEGLANAILARRCRSQLDRLTVRGCADRLLPTLPCALVARRDR
jgi:hypothetical protein